MVIHQRGTSKTSLSGKYKVKNIYVLQIFETNQKLTIFGYVANQDTWQLKTTYILLSANRPGVREPLHWVSGWGLMR